MFVPESNWTGPASLPDLSSFNEVSLDTETKDDGLAAGAGPGWHAGAGYVAGVSVAWAGGALYVPLRHPDSECVDRRAFVRWLRALFAQDHTRFVGHNLNYDLGWLQADLGVRPPAQLDDTGAMAAMVDENRLSYSLDSLCAWRDLPGKDEALLREAVSAYYGPRADVKSSLWRLPARFVGPYAEADAAQTLALKHSLMPEIEAQGMSAAYALEADLIPMTLEMRRRGIRVDVDGAERLASNLEVRRDAVLKELSDLLGHTTTLADVRRTDWLTRTCDSLNSRLSPTDKLYINYPRTAPTEKHAEGQASFEASWMRTHQHPLPRLVSRAKQLDDLASKFLRTYIIGYAHKGRVHATVNQFRNEGGGTRSHRMSYSDPPLQQIPSRDDELAPLVRGVFLPEPGEVWAAPDYNQQEYRLIVHFAELLKLRKASVAGDKYRSDVRTDFHNLVVEMTALPRRRAKDVNFAKSYGAGIAKFASMTGMSEAEAERTINQYDEELPFVKEEGERCEALAQRRGWIRLIDGARCHFDQWEAQRRDYRREQEWLRANPRGRGVAPCDEEEALSRTKDASHPWFGQRTRRAFTRKAMNRLVQGSAARQKKIAMREMWREGIPVILDMHDELDLSVAEERTAQRGAEIMREAVALTVPMLVDVDFGATWGRAAVRKDPQGRVTYGATWAEAVAEARAISGT